MLSITAVPEVCQLDHPAEETRTYSNILKERKSATKASLEPIAGRSVIDLGSNCESTNSRIRYSKDSKMHSISQEKSKEVESVICSNCQKSLFCKICIKASLSTMFVYL